MGALPTCNQQSIWAGGRQVDGPAPDVRAPRQWPGSMVEISPFSRRSSTYVSASSWGHATTSATPDSWASCGRGRA